MADASDPYSDNPFRQLDKSRFPRKREQPSPAPRRDRRISRHETLTPEDEEASALFLRAMARGGGVGRRRETGGGMPGVTLADCTPLPAGGKRKKRGKRERARAVEAPSPAPASAAGDAEDDGALFLDAMKEVRPLQGRGRDVPPAVEPAVAAPVAGELSLQDFMDGKLEFALSFTDEYLEGHVVGLDPMIMNKLREGSLSPEAHFDLHGLNVQQAFESMRGFVRGCWYRGLRVVLLVPGRGRNSPDGVGVLRGKVQSWLTQDPFKRVVLAFCTAQPHDGGPGSIYVLLRKYKKKGRVYWERLPADADLC